MDAGQNNGGEEVAEVGDDQGGYRRGGGRGRYITGGYRPRRGRGGFRGRGRGIGRKFGDQQNFEGGEQSNEGDGGAVPEATNGDAANEQ